jgi:NADH:ubiquinone reductase (H+-translocating)
MFMKGESIHAMNDLAIPETTRARVVIVGGGFAGLKLARKLTRKKFQVVLLDRNNYHNFQPLLYQIAMGGLEPDSIAFPLRKWLRKKSAFFRMTTVEEVVPDENKVVTTDGALSYDHLIIATGSKSNFFGNSSVEKNALTLKSIPGALDIRSWIFQTLESAVYEKRVQDFLNIIIVGGGPTGVEIAGALADLKNHVLPRDYPELFFSGFRIILVEGSAKILGSMSEQASRHATESLQRMGVELMTGKQLKEYNGHEAILSSGEKIRTQVLIWSAGVIANPIKGLSPDAVQKDLRYKTDRYNRITGYENIFAVGDVAGMTKAEGKSDPMLAPVAIQQANNLARNLNLTTAVPWREFRYVNKGVLATIGRNKAVADFGPLHFHGFAAWIIWVFVHLMTLVGFRNRIIVFMNWLISYISFDSAIRLILRPLKKREPFAERANA